MQVGIFQLVEKSLFLKLTSDLLSLSPLGHSDGFASCKAWCVLISASMPNCPLSPVKGCVCFIGSASCRAFGHTRPASVPGVNTGTGVPATRLGATPKARMLWLLAKSYKQGRLCQLNRAVARCNGTNS